MTRENKTFTVKLNKRARTATIRVYYNNKFYCKYRTCEMSRAEFEDFSYLTQSDIANFLKNEQSYYEVK